jgi:hypothetical protein
MTNALTWLRALLWVRYPRPSDFYVWKLKRPEDLGRATHPDHGRKDFPCVVMIIA